MALQAMGRDPAAADGEPGPDRQTRKIGGSMELLTVPNIVSGVLVLLMLFFLRQVFRADVGDSRGTSVLILVVLGVLLYLARTDAGMDFIRQMADLVG
jgi:hypothetical protein